MLDTIALVRANQWASWDGNLEGLPRARRLELAWLFGALMDIDRPDLTPMIEIDELLCRMPFHDLQAAAQLLADKWMAIARGE